MKTQQWNPVNAEQAIRLYKSGMTQLEVATELNCSQTWIGKILHEASVQCRKAAPRCQAGSANNNWKGSEVTYAAFHYRLRALKGSPRKCEQCGTADPLRHYDWANMTGHYEDPKDYKRLCRSCHWKHDQKQNNFGSTFGKPPKWCKESRRKLSASKTGKGNAFYGKRHSDNSKLLMSESGKEAWKKRRK